MIQSSHTHKSSTSQLVKSVSQLMTEDELTDGDLVKQVNFLKRQLKLVTLENEILENTIMRLEPSLMHGIQQAMEYALRMQSTSTIQPGSFVKSQTSKYGLESLISLSRMLTSPSKVSSKKADSVGKVTGTVIFGTGPRINVLERSELVTTEMEIIMKNLENYRKKAAKQHALLKAQLEVIGLREIQIKNASEQFNREVIVEGWDKIAQRIPAEVWVRFMYERMKIIDSQIGKSRLRTSTLNTQYSKLKGQIKTKSELSESLRPVDFEKLKIENKECVKTIDYKIQQLEELKKLTGDANLNLTVHKKAMMEQDEYLKKVTNSKKDKEKETVALDKEVTIIQAQVDNLEVELEGIKKIKSTYEVPNIMDYVKVKAEVTDLKHSIKVLENRAHIQDIALVSLNKKLKSIYMDVK